MSHSCKQLTSLSWSGWFKPRPGQSPLMQHITLKSSVSSQLDLRVLQKLRSARKYMFRRRYQFKSMRKESFQNAFTHRRTQCFKPSRVGLKQSVYTKQVRGFIFLYFYMMVPFYRLQKFSNFRRTFLYCSPVIIALASTRTNNVILYLYIIYVFNQAVGRKKSMMSRQILHSHSSRRRSVCFRRAPVVN